MTPAPSLHSSTRAYMHGCIMMAFCVLVVGFLIASWVVDTHLEEEAELDKYM